MKTRSNCTVLIRIVLIIALSFLGCAGQRPVAAPQQNTPESSAHVEPVRWELPNGIKVLFLEDHELPLVRGSILIPGGTLWEPAADQGVVSAMGEQMRQGGAGGLSADQLDLRLEQLSAQVSSGFGPEFGSVGFSCLSGDFKEVFGIAADVLLRPRFEQNRLDLWKGQALEGIARRVDDPSTVAGIALKQLMYGGNPLGRVTIDSDVKKIERGSLIAAHNKFVYSQGAMLIISGDISRAQLDERLRTTLMGWSKARQIPLQPPEFAAPQNEPGIYFIRQPLAQSTVFMGQLGIPRHHPDEIPSIVFNDVFGSGSFGSRLVRVVRTQLGLAYSVFGGILPGYPIGRNLMALQTKSDSTAQAADATIRELLRMQAEPVSANEMDESRSGIKNSFVFNFDSAPKIVSRRGQLELMGYPDNYDKIYLPAIFSVEPAKLLQMARDDWNLNQLMVVVVGNEKAYDSLNQAAQSSGSLLFGRPIREVTFDQKLRLSGEESH